MMKLNHLLVACLVLASCNDSKNETTTTSGDSTTSTVAKTGSPAASGGCTNLYLFREGAVIEGANYDAGGKQTSTQSSTVLKVTAEGGTLVSEVEMKSNVQGQDERVFTGKYSCDGKKLYVDLTNLFGSMDARGTKIEGDPVEFPINISDGEILPDASYTMRMKQAGNEMKITSIIKDRKVTGKESVTTPAGTFNCYKISANVDAKIEFEGGDEKMKQMMEAIKRAMPKKSFVMYFDPAISIVKMEMFDDGKLTSRSEITSIRNK
jgi:hypothetical protein